MNKDKLIFLGDIHGEFEKIAAKIKQLGIRDSFIIQLGDFGMGFVHPEKEARKLKFLNDVLVEQNIEMFVLRGNHENPAFFKTCNNPYGHSNIVLMPDYSEINLLGQNILMVGGAVSIDRKWRKEEISWWPDEEFVFDPAFDYKQYNVVCTHTRPIESGLCLGYKNIKAFLDADKTLLHSLEEENKNMSKLYEKIKGAKSWFAGHFHLSAVSHINGTTFRILDIDELYEHRINP